MMKNIFIIIIFTLVFYSNGYALNSVIINPDYSFIQGVAIDDGTPNLNDPIRDNSNSANRFCVEMGGSYVSHTSTLGGIGSTRYKVIDSNWIHSNNNSIIDTITCDIPNSSTSGGINVNGIIGPGSLNIITVNDGKIYIEKDNFFYLIVTLFVILLLLKSVIFIFITSYKVGKNLSSGKGLKFK